MAGLSKQLTAHLTEVNARIPKPDPRFDAAKKKAQLQITQTKKKAQLERAHANFLKPDFEPNKNWWGSKGTVD